MAEQPKSNDQKQNSVGDQKVSVQQDTAPTPTQAKQAEIAEPKSEKAIAQPKGEPKPIESALIKTGTKVTLRNPSGRPAAQGGHVILDEDTSVSVKEVLPHGAAGHVGIVLSAPLKIEDKLNADTEATLYVNVSVDPSALTLKSAQS